MYLEAPAERIRKVYLSQSLYEEKGESFVKGHDVEILEGQSVCSGLRYEDTTGCAVHGTAVSLPVRRPVEEKRIHC